MKKNTILVLIGICFTFSANAQFGIRAGLNSSKISINIEDELFDIEQKIGFHLGGIYDIPMSGKSDIRIGALFSTKGFNIDISDANFVNKLTLKTAHIDVPISYIYYLNQKTKGLYIEGGLVPSLLLSANSESTFSIVGEPEETFSDDVKEDFPRLDVGLSLGLGYRIQKNVSIGFNYSLGLVNQIIDANENESAKNRVASLHLIYEL